MSEWHGQDTESKGRESVERGLETELEGCVSRYKVLHGRHRLAVMRYRCHMIVARGKSSWEKRRRSLSRTKPSSGSLTSSLIFQRYWRNPSFFSSTGFNGVLLSR